MSVIDASKLTDEALIAYDKMMTEVAIKIADIAPLSIAVWTDALTELDRRGHVRLISGSYEDIGNALVQRQYEG